MGGDADQKLPQASSQETGKAGPWVALDKWNGLVRGHSAARLASRRGYGGGGAPLRTQEKPGVGERLLTSKG